ncbi:uncharacterized protein LOC115739413 [Rhodamnia argentea]|uniref:non-specific serine/threonine protein kinase n=1 Tax=Rhodamnia argentea TaxID=178133 RepID=A0A8B8P3B8_9MYRT|nr:uncharacterized protein LOC115739413 [Rhodamnia argentea]
MPSSPSKYEDIHRSNRSNPMERALTLCFVLTLLLNLQPAESPDPACRNTCGSLTVKYPFGTGYGCGSPRFHPYVTCFHAQDRHELVFATHTGLYPITSISYTTSTLIISPPYMSTCTSMKPSPNLGLDWSGPFELGSSTFVLLHCDPSTTSLTVKGSPICDRSSPNLCSSMYACPAVLALGLPPFSPTNTCCVYSPANFDGKGELDLQALECSGYAPVVSLGDYPTDPTQWEYGVELKYTQGAFESNHMDTKCPTCENSGGACGYDSPSLAFLCVCGGGYNTSTDCNIYNQVEGIIWSSASFPSRKNRWSNLGYSGLVLTAAACSMNQSLRKLFFQVGINP